MTHHTDDLRIEQLRPLLPPAILLEEIPLTTEAAALVAKSRKAASSIIHNQDDRLLVIIGPCSIHDPEAAIEYGKRLAEKIQAHAGELLIFMRVYFEKPRTTVGWKGLINDPHINSTYEINKGVRIARRLLADLAELGVPAGTEYLDTISPQFFSDLVAWGAIGARTTESQIHRELASGLSMPVGFKNGTGGSIQLAVDAVRSARHPHHFLSVTKQGIAAIVSTSGNEDCHIILRGGTASPNYDEASVQQAAALLEKADLPGSVMIDFSHGNSFKDHRRQHEVSVEVSRQVAAGSRSIMGVMIESHLVEGRQDWSGRENATWGQSITDACIGWDESVELLDMLAAAVSERRKRA